MNVRTLVSLCLLAACTPAGAAELAVTVAGVRSAQGTVGLSIVDSADAWDGKAKAVVLTQLPAKEGSVVFHVPDLPPGRYAASVRHDENGNDKLDVNVTGIPIEGYGFSNNPDVMRKATFDEARFDLGADGGAITIDLR